MKLVSAAALLLLLCSNIDSVLSQGVEGIRCPALRCRSVCSDGFFIDSNGCQTCSCRQVCPILEPCTIVRCEGGSPAVRLMRSDGCERCICPRPGPSLKPGRCPRRTPRQIGVCLASCGTDSECPGNEKCCGSCPRECTRPVSVGAIGTCPRRPRGTRRRRQCPRNQRRRNRCRNNSDCRAGGRICCRNPCGVRRCIRPVSQ